MRILIYGAGVIGEKSMKNEEYKKAQEERIETLEQAVKDLTEELDDREDNLYQKQKGVELGKKEIREVISNEKSNIDINISRNIVGRMWKGKGWK